MTKRNSNELEADTTIENITNPADMPSADDFFNATGEIVNYEYLDHIERVKGIAVLKRPSILTIQVHGNIELVKTHSFYGRMLDKYEMAQAPARPYLSGLPHGELIDGKILIVRKEVAEFLQVYGFDELKCRKLVTAYVPLTRDEEPPWHPRLFICWYSK